MGAPLTVDELRPLPMFAELGDGRLAQLLEAGETVATEAGAELFTEGLPAEHWWVLVEGAIALSRRVGRSEQVVARMDVPGRWAGGFRAWDDHGTYLATGRVVDAGRVLRVPSDRLRALTDEWFPLGGHLITGVFHTARSIDATARQHGALVTLGTLAAGLAHELNNPAAAATRSVDEVQVLAGQVLDSLRDLAVAGIAAEQYAALDARRTELRPPVIPLSALDRADLEQELGLWLGGREVDDPWRLASALVPAGADTAWCARVTDVVGSGPALTPAFTWLARTAQVRLVLRDARESVRRISTLVNAVRSYSQVDRAATQDVDLVEGIESTLVVLGHKLRDGVTVVRDYADDVPKIAAYPGELNQVWTNLVDNAVDAMEGAGTLTITTRLDDDHVVVEVADTGPGVPAEVAGRVFEAFFTTKDVGKGTGLGLDIARRIVVERHLGTIDVDGGPGGRGAVMRVRLPVRRPG
jgi:signal transduction histidine kinase